jgi:glucose-6-phosphate isomerase
VPHPDPRGGEEAGAENGPRSGQGRRASRSAKQELLVRATGWAQPVLNGRKRLTGDTCRLLDYLSGVMALDLSFAHFANRYVEYPELQLALDYSCMACDDEYLDSLNVGLEKALEAMAQLEHGAIANPDEGRMVGHYWLRAPELAPSDTITSDIRQALSSVKQFASDVLSGSIAGADGTFQNLLVIGIGGSALGPQFVSNALGTLGAGLSPHFFDNTDPDGMDRVLASLDSNLGRTLCVVISKSGGTKETRNGMLEAKAAYDKAGLSFAAHAVAVTGQGSNLDKLATSESWLARFPMWDWVGGRTSETSAVGLLPAALEGIDIDGLLAGARACDEATRRRDRAGNPAALLALLWYASGAGRGEKAMVVLPYKDRIELLSRYLQQLVMESLGKKRDLEGRIVNQGLVVYGNKGSTDQHAYVQQLVDGTHNFFTTFIEVLRDRQGASLEVEPGVTSGDYLMGFLLGTRRALAERNRESITLTIDEVTPFSVGVLVALYERAVGLYAHLIGINAYHQPGVEAGKVAAQSAVDLQAAILSLLTRGGATLSAVEIADSLGRPADAVTVFKICQHLSRNGRVQRADGDGAAARFRAPV